jgi:hypothetical protein
MIYRVVRLLTDNLVHIVMTHSLGGSTLIGITRLDQHLGVVLNNHNKMRVHKSRAITRVAFCESLVGKAQKSLTITTI